MGRYEQDAKAAKLTMRSALPSQYQRLKAQYDELSAQFTASQSSSAFSGTEQTSSAAISTPNDPSLAQDFAAATSKPTAHASKSVRFTDDPSGAPDPAAAGLFPYRDEPDGPPDQSDMTNQQIHAYHSDVLREQDEQLDALGASIGRQRDLSIQIGDELDDHAMMLDDVDNRVDRHQSQLDRARGRLGKVARKAKDNWSMTTIIVLIVILVLLIVITK
jgi:syntaxin 8